jgi:hypothetical protein
MAIVKQKTKFMDNRTVLDTDNIPVKTILILATNPQSTPRLRLDEEVREIEQGLKRSRHRHRFEIHSKWAVRHRDIRQALLDYEPNFLHFTGHGKEDGLVVEDEMGMAVRFSSKALSELFKLCASNVECVILNACYSAPQAVAINKHIDYVIGMKKAIKDKAAIEFSGGFYDALGAGRSIEDAFAIGRAAVLAKFPELPEYVIPTLKKKKGMVNLLVYLETTADIYDVRVSLDNSIADVKNRLIDELKLAKTFEDGKSVQYYLLSKTRDKIMEERKTLRENEVRENEVFTFLIEMDENV